MSIAARMLTAEEFAALPGSQQSELIHGEMVETIPPGGQQGTIAALLSSYLIQWARQQRSGLVGIESGFVLSRNPDTLRGPDVYYVRSERVPTSGAPDGFWLIAPDLAVEIVSPSESADDLRGKVRDYLAAGTLTVWVVYPRTREVIVHMPNGLARAYGSGDTLENLDALPGFSCPVSALFEA